MASSLFNLVNNISEGIHRIKCKYGHDDKKCQNCGIKYKYCDCFLEYTNFKDDLMQYKCLRCNKNYQHQFDEKLKKLNRDNKGVYPYEYKKVFILMKIWLIGKNLMKHHYLKKKIFTVT